MPTVTHYGSSSNLALLIAGLSDSVSSNQSDYAMTLADNWINSNLTPGQASITTPPTLVGAAADMKAMHYILSMLYGTSDTESPMSAFYKNEAEQFLASYDSMYPGDENYDTMHPYSNSQSPTQLFTKRNIRSTYDYNVYDYVPDNIWTTEAKHATES